MKKILIIEDNKDVRENLTEILQLDGYEVYAGENGKVGIKLAHEKKPDLILCDVMMPELDGFGVLKILNRTATLNHIPFIFLTAKSEKNDFRKGMGLGAEDYITKPFDDMELLSSIEMRLKKAERLYKEIDNSEAGVQRFFSEARAEQEFENLSIDKEVRKVASKEIIYETDDQARWLYYIVEGQVKIYSVNEYGKELTIQLCGPGDFFGYFSLISEKPYSHNAACLKDCVLRLIPKEDFMLLLFNNRDFAAKFIKLIANKTEDTETKLLDLAYSSVRKKVANALVEYCQSLDKKGTGVLKVQLSREDLAALAGTTKETAIRTLSDFKNERLIKVDGKSIIILDLEALTNLIG
jgi:CRP-like cAMP-binding protein